MNFPAEHRLHLGYHWNQPAQNPVLAEADVILVLGSDVPWIPAHNRPDPAARIYVIDLDPIKIGCRCGTYPPPGTHGPTSPPRCGQLDNPADRARAARPEAVADRAARTGGPSRRPAGRVGATGADRPPTARSPPSTWWPASARPIGPDALVLNEAITNYHVVTEHLRASRPGSLLGSGGGSLGWAGGAAVGAKLAAPDRTVVSLVGDGSYLFAVTVVGAVDGAAVRAPSLTVIFDNQGWKAPSLSDAGGASGRGESRPGRFAASFQPEADLPGVAAAAGGAYARTVTAAALARGDTGPDAWGRCAAAARRWSACMWPRCNAGDRQSGRCHPG